MKQIQRKILSAKHCKKQPEKKNIFLYRVDPLKIIMP